MNNLSTRKSAIYSKLEKLEQTKERLSFLSEQMFNEVGGYNYNVLDDYLSLTKTYNLNVGAVKRMIQNLLNDYYCGTCSWVHGKDLYIYINAFNKI